jgi:hypothetical protein
MFGTFACVCMCTCICVVSILHLTGNQINDVNFQSINPIWIEHCVARVEHYLQSSSDFGHVLITVYTLSWKGARDLIFSGSPSCCIVSYLFLYLKKSKFNL